MNKDELKKGEKVSAIATIVTFFLAVIKLGVGLTAGSVLLVADGIHSTVDIFAIFASWFGLKISQREPNQKFPFGYYKAENFATLIAVIFILYAGYEIILQSYEALFTEVNYSFGIVILFVPLFSIIVAFFISFYEKKVGKEINSQSLIANAQESRADIFSSILVFVGIGLSIMGIKYAAGIVGFVIALFIIKIGLENGKIALYSLMDANLDKGLSKKIEDIILEISGVKGVSNIKIRQSGVIFFGEANLKINKSIDVNRAHAVTEKIEEKIKKSYPHITSFLLHIEPEKENEQIIMLPIAKNNGIDSEIIGHFGRAKNLLFVNLDMQEKKILSWHVKENIFRTKKIRAGLSVSKEIMAEKPTVVILNQIGEIAYHALRDNYIDIYITNGNNSKQVIKKFLGGELKILRKPTHESDVKK
ncbi:MAG: cation diffusion facilitator family transporter [Candidatus Diapherotrites archaeon]|jgi:cation diffusion facilitator family transporter|uniref:Cation diffusion facilitator family transporter n=1 Tax=Candidatus Iainarchaeum sp. TaxID=3101447 RepID=A0A8T5GFM2_9ARCH|nr:cation diffusion facilitator family transporter [Candidatus Diapherotrites archaeon]